MIARATRLAILLAFAFAPLAQAVECIMHVPAAVEAVGHDGGHAHHTDSNAMPVAACFAAAMDAVLAGDTVYKLPVFVVDAPSHVFAIPQQKALPQAVAARWRGPPEDVLMLSRRWRI